MSKSVFKNDGFALPVNRCMQHSAAGIKFHFVLDFDVRSVQEVQNLVIQGLSCNLGRGSERMTWRNREAFESVVCV